MTLSEEQKDSFKSQLKSQQFVCYKLVPTKVYFYTKNTS